MSGATLSASKTVASRLFFHWPKHHCIRTWLPGQASCASTACHPASRLAALFKDSRGDIRTAARDRERWLRVLSGTGKCISLTEYRNELSRRMVHAVDHKVSGSLGIVRRGPGYPSAHCVIGPCDAPRGPYTAVSWQGCVAWVGIRPLQRALQAVWLQIDVFPESTCPLYLTDNATLKCGTNVEYLS